MQQFSHGAEVLLTKVMPLREKVEVTEDGDAMEEWIQHRTAFGDSNMLVHNPIVVHSSYVCLGLQH